MLRLGFIPFSYYVIADCFDFKSHRTISTEVLFKQIKFTGLEALSLIFSISFVLSVLIIAQGYPLLTSIGQQALIYDILIASIVRDGGPFIVCFIVLARSGTAITTELGNMVVTKEIDALNAMGISIIPYLVAPRVLGMFFSIILLMSYFVFAGTISSFLTVSLFNHMPLLRFVNELLNQLSIIDLVIMFAKVVLCGVFSALISCFHGLKVNKAVTEVPQRNIKAVGQSLTIICIVHLVLSSTLLLI